MDLNKLLKERKMTQFDLSLELERRFKCYRTQTIISRWFSGKILPNIQMVVYLSEILNVSCEDLIKGFLEKHNESLCVCN